MVPSPVDASFAAFRRDADPRHLAAVFDATAAELLRVASHLAADAHAAEDLVQATFLRAIEHRQRYEPSLPVLPWLLGILANLARHERRQRQRTLPPPPAADQPSTLEQAADAEEHARLRATLRGLPQPYRHVLLLQVEHGLDSRQIAEVTGRKAATVRTQIARGMDLLRAALPAGVVAVAASLPAAEAVGAGLASVRAIVLQHAAASTAAGTTGLTFGSLIMKKVLVAVAGLLALMSGWWWFAQPSEAPPRALVAAADTDAAADPAAPGNAASNAVGGTTAGARQDLAASTTGSLRVVVRFEDGSAAADVGVYVAGEHLLPLGREATTDRGGAATFDALPLGAVVVKPDRGVASPFTVAAGANDLELRLAAGVDVEGRVTDQTGKVAIPRATIFALSREHHDRAQRLTEADDGGRFRLRAVGPRAHLFARAPGYQPSDPKRETVPPLAQGPLQVELRLGAPGSSLHGRVTTAAGAPAAFATLAVAVDEHARRFADGLRGRPSGMSRQRDVDAFLLRADAEGCYTTDEVPEGEALVLARAAPDQAPGVALLPTMVLAGVENRCDVVLQSGAQLVGIVRDEAGKPFAGLPLLTEWRGTDRVRFEGAFDHLLASAAATTDAGGNFHLPGLLPGEHQLLPMASLGADVRIQQQGEQRVRVVLVGSERRWLDLEVPRRGDLAVRLLGPDGAPIAGFGIWADRNRRPTPHMSELEAQRTGADGRACIRGLPLGEALCITAFGPRPREAGDRLVDRFPARQWFDVLVRDEELVLQLAANDVPTGVLAGRFVDRAGAVLAVDSCELRRDGWGEVRRLPAKDGAFAPDALPAGRYWLEPSVRGRPLLGPFDLGPGQRLELGDLVLDEPGSLRVLVVAADGGPIRRVRAQLVSADPGHVTSDLQLMPEGLVTSRRPPGKYRLWISASDLAPSVHDVEVISGVEQHLSLRVPRGFVQRFAVTVPTPVAPTREGWVVDYSVFHDDDGVSLLVHDGNAPALEFGVPLARGRWMIRWNVPGGPRTSTWFTLDGDQPAPPIALRPQ